MLVVVFIQLMVTATIDILVIVGLWDVVALSIFILAFLFPALFTNTVLKHDHPRSIRKLRWEAQKVLNEYYTKKIKGIPMATKELTTINAITKQKNHIQLLDGALAELNQDDIEVKILGFAVTESVLAQLATIIGTGISAISAQLSQSNTA